MSARKLYSGTHAANFRIIPHKLGIETGRYKNTQVFSSIIRYARACSSYECFILRAMRLSNKLLGQGYVKERLKSSLRKFYGRYGDLTKQYEVPLSRMLHDILDDDHIQ